MCKSNTHVQHVRPSYDAGAEAVRFYAGSSFAAAIVCMIYKCTNPNCVGVQAAARNRSKKEPNAKRAKQTVAYQFRSTAADQLAMLPKYVRTQFPCVLLRVGGYSFDLADVLLTSAANSMQTATQVHEMWGRRQYRTMHDYITFAHGEQVKAQAQERAIQNQVQKTGVSSPKEIECATSKPLRQSTLDSQLPAHAARAQQLQDAASSPSLPLPAAASTAAAATPSATSIVSFTTNARKFPSWKPVPDDSIMAPPSVKVLEGFLQHVYDAIYPYLYSDLIRRSPGRFMCSDGTFKITRITNSDGRVCILFIGEDGTICGFYVVESESWANLELALYQLRDRLQWLGTLDELLYWYTDRCCDGCTFDKLDRHVLVKILGIQRAPLADAFHGIQALVHCTGTCTDSSIHTAYSKEVGQIICKPYEPDIFAVAKKLMKRDQSWPNSRRLIKVKPRGALPTEEDYVALVKERNTWDDSIRKVRRAPAVLEAELKDLYKRYQNIPGWELQSNRHAGITGTKESYEEVYKHLRNFCYSDPFPVDEMYRRTGTTAQLKRDKYSFLGGSGRCETANSSLNRRFTGDISHISQEKQQRNITLWVNAKNQRIDRHADLADEICRGTFMFERHLLNQLSTTALESVPFPRTEKKVAGFSADATKEPRNHLFGWDYYEHQKYLHREQMYSRTLQEFHRCPTVPSSRRSEVATAATGEHRVAKRSGTILNALPITGELNDDERELMVQCVYKAKKELHNGASEMDQFACAADLFIAELVLNDALPKTGQRELRGRLEASKIQKEYKGTASNVAVKRMQATVPASIKRKAVSRAKGSTKKKREYRELAATKHIEACDPISIKTTGNHVHFEILELKIGDRQDKCTSSKACQVCSESDNSIMRAYLKLMVAEKPHGDKLRMGRAMSKCKDRAHLLGQLTTFFKFRKDKTFTPEGSK
jgi:hypothetical protein